MRCSDLLERRIEELELELALESERGKEVHENNDTKSALEGIKIELDISKKERDDALDNM